MFLNVIALQQNISHYTTYNIIRGGQYCFFYGFYFFEKYTAYLIGHRSVYSSLLRGISICMTKYYKIHTFGLICCRIINCVLFTHVHIKFDDGWWHILYSVQPNTRHLATQSHDVTGFFLFKKSSSLISI